MALIERLAGWGVLCLPGALVVFLSFNAGGYFPGAPAFLAVILLLCLVARVLAAERPFEGFSPALGVCAAALALYALWAYISSSWSDSDWRAAVEFDRALLYLAALAFFGSFARTDERIRWMTRSVAVGILVVCTIALLTRILPEVWPIGPDISTNRLSYPLTYWNALGILAAIGTILCFHIAASRSEHRAIEVVAAGAVPIVATTVFFTLSRGAIAAGTIGLLCYLLIGWPRDLVRGVLAVAPATAVVLVVSYHADLLTGDHPTSDAAIAQGHHVAAVLVGCALAAAALRVALSAVHIPAPRVELPWERWAAFLPSVGAVLVCAAVAVGIALGGPGYVHRQYDRFVHGNRVHGTSSNAASRLTDPGNNGRLELWRVAVDDGFDPHKLHGVGAGDFENLWAADRPRSYSSTAHDGHSLYIENLAELGLVGILLVAGFLLTILYGFASGARGPERASYAALFGAGLAWAFHAGVDWDWEMPAVTIWLFVLGGAALAAREAQARLYLAPPLALRAAISAALLGLAVVPASVAISQSKMGDAIDTFDSRGDCPQVIKHANDSLSFVGSRPDAYQLRGYCQARLGRGRQAIVSMKKAVSRDPKAWEYSYSLAVAQAAAGVDPMPAARRALRLDPLESDTQDLVDRFAGGGPNAWRSQAAPLLQSPIF